MRQIIYLSGIVNVSVILSKQAYYIMNNSVLKLSYFKTSSIVVSTDKPMADYLSLALNDKK